MSKPDQHSDYPQRAWHALPASEVVIAVDSDASEGLSREEARRRLERFGPNALPEPARHSWSSVFLSQFKSPLIYLLLAAVAIALSLGHISDAAVITTVLLVNAFVGALQEGRAERSLSALRKLATHETRVVREGQQIVIDAGEVVPGDVLLLEAGDAIPADARLLHAAALQIAEAALTGESVPVAKDPLPAPADAPLAERLSMIYTGTHLTAGRARAVVVATGLDTEIGHIGALAEAAEQPKTPLERRIARFGRQLIVAAAVLFVSVNAIGVLRGIPFSEIVMVSISQVVSMIPEGLPAAITIALAVGVQRMARRRAVVRRLAAVETLGSITVICSDKTGTLTRNEMTVAAVCLPDGRELSVGGVGYEPRGQFFENDREIAGAEMEALRPLLEAATLCNDARLPAPHGSDTNWKPIGDPTEAALLTLAMKGGIVLSELRARWPRRAEIPFDSASNMMATQHDTEQGPRVIVKGAFEDVLELCHGTRSNRQNDSLDAASAGPMADAAQSMAQRAMRVLAIGVADGAEIDVRAGFAALQGRTTLLGLVGEIDPPRPEVKEAVERCRAAGIRPVVVTGDHKATGYAIAKTLGIAREGDAAIDGRELEQMSDAELADRIDGISVFARVHPAQKLRIVDAYQRRRHVVAMTGDGVNDAPALVKADVGVAMGITGTEVAKESAKIVIADDNFATIVAAVEEGRVVYRNIKKVILYLLSTSLPAVVVLFVAVALGYPPPLAAVQILWINLVTEGTITVNLIMEPAEGVELRQKPVFADEPLITRQMWTRIAVLAPAIATSMLGWFLYRFAIGVPMPEVQTEVFTLLAVAAWFNVLNCRSAKDSAFNSSLLKNRWLIAGLAASGLLQIAVLFFAPLGEVFHTVPLGVKELVCIVAVASLVLWVEELRKLFVRRRERRLTLAV